MSLAKSMSLVLGLVAAGCGGEVVTAPSGDGTTSQRLAPQQQVAATVIATGSHAATVDVTVDWTVSGNNVDVYVTRASCLELTAIAVGDCLALVGAASPTAKPERLSFSAAPDSSYKIFVINRGSMDDTVTVTVALH